MQILGTHPQVVVTLELCEYRPRTCHFTNQTTNHIVSLQNMRLKRSRLAIKLVKTRVPSLEGSRSDSNKVVNTSCTISHARAREKN